MSTGSGGSSQEEGGSDARAQAAPRRKEGKADAEALAKKKAAAEKQKAAKAKREAEAPARKQRAEQRAAQAAERKRVAAEKRGSSGQEGWYDKKERNRCAAQSSGGRKEKRVRELIAQGMATRRGQYAKANEAFMGAIRTNSRSAAAYSGSERSHSSSKFDKALSHHGKSASRARYADRPTMGRLLQA